MKKIITRVVSIIFILLLSLFAVYFFVEYRNKELFKKVDLEARNEIEKIDLEFSFDSYNKHSEYGCKYDSKVKATRCNTHYQSYFGSYKDQIATYNEINDYLINLGWKETVNNPDRLQGMKRLTDAGYSISNSYYKPGVNGNIKLSLSIYGQNTNASGEIKDLFQQSDKQFKSVYAISISTDF